MNCLIYLGAEAPVQQYACSFWVFKGGSNIYISLDSHTHRNSYLYPVCMLLQTKLAQALPWMQAICRHMAAIASPEAACECPVICCFWKEKGL